MIISINNFRVNFYFRTKFASYFTRSQGHLRSHHGYQTCRPGHVIMKQFLFCCVPSMGVQQKKYDLLEDRSYFYSFCSNYMTKLEKMDRKIGL